MKESQLENKTAIATNDYVRMVDENGNSVKIKKDSFMAAIRDALPSIISDGETGGGSVLSIINGALKTRTDANLASVLGVPKPTTPYTVVSSLEELNAVKKPSIVHYTSNVTGHSDYGIVVTWVFGSNWYSLLQMELTYNKTIYVRMNWNYENPSSTWSDWKEI